MLNRFTLGFLLLGQLCLVGCDEINGSLTLQLKRPSGFAIVEDGWLMVGQENGDQATFVQLDPETGVAEELMSPAFYLPLSWDIQAEARSWESTDGGALYVSGLSGEVEFVDFLAARDGLSLSQSTTRSGALFSAGVGNIRRSSEECTEPCIAKAWATVPSAGEVVEFTIIRESAGYQWTTERILSVGGTPWDLEIASDNSRLVGTDLEGQRIFSVDLSNEDVQSLSIGTIAGPISLSTDNQVLLVARPQLEDALLLDVAELTGKALENISGPALSCIASCGADNSEDVCSGLHPYNQQVCRNDSDTLEQGSAYDGLYLDLHAKKVVALGAGAGDDAWFSTCDEANRYYDEVFIVMGIQNGVRFIGKERESAAYELISDSWCKTLRTGASTNIEVLSSALAEPGEIVADDTDIDSVFTVFEVDPNAGQDEVEPEDVVAPFKLMVARWVVGDHRLEVTWEGLADGQLSRPLGGGVLTADEEGDVDLVDDLGLNLLRFTDDVNLGDDLRLQGKCGTDEPCGDLLVLTEGLTLTDTCLSTLGAADEAEASCLLERRIDSVVEREGNTYWQLDAPIPSACRPASGRIGYEVRAAREFSVSSDRRLYRVGPGKRFGFGTSIGAREPIHLRFKDVESSNPCAPPEGLTRGETGTLQLLGANRISTGASWPSGVWKLNQSSDGIAFDIDFSLPSDLKVWRSEQYGTGVLMSLTGSNRLIYFRPVFAEGTTDTVSPLDVFRSPEWYQDTSRFWLIQ